MNWRRQMVEGQLELVARLLGHRCVTIMACRPAGIVLYVEISSIESNIAKVSMVGSWSPTM